MSVMISHAFYGWTFCASSNDAKEQTTYRIDHTYMVFHLLTKKVKVNSDAVFDIVIWRDSSHSHCISNIEYLYVLSNAV